MEHLNRKIAFLFTCLLVVSTVLLNQGCYYDNEEELYPYAFCDSIDNVTYTSNIEQITKANCATSGCHTGTSPAGGLFLDTYQQVKTIGEDGRMSTRALVMQDMPPSGPLSACEMEAIQQWINNGTPE
jgi:hypothetical protein